VRDQVSHPYETRRIIIVLYSLIFTSLDEDPEQLSDIALGNGLGD
jgi:hypothetical protein